jgi:hypothetical protein
MEKHLEKLRHLNTYMRLKIDCGINESFDYWVNNIRYCYANNEHYESQIYYTYNKHFNADRYSNNYDSNSFIATQKLFFNN